MKPKTKRMLKRVGTFLLVAILGGLVASFAMTAVNGIDSSEVSKIAKVRFTMYLLEDLSAGDAMYIDNAAFLVI